MCIYRQYLIIGCFAIITSLFGPVIGEENPVIITTVTGGESTIYEVEPGIFQVHIQDIIPNASVLYDDRSVLVPLQYAFMGNSSIAALHLTDNNEEEKTFLVRAEDIRYFEENQSLVCEITPQELYNGNPLVPDQTRADEVLSGLYTLTNISFEYSIQGPENSPVDSCCTFDEMDTKKCVPMRPLCGY